jgi:hypothetical protein
MNLKFWEPTKSVYDEPIETVLAEMRDEGPESERYPKLIVQLERLSEMKAAAKKFRVNGDTLLIVGGNLLGILIIVAYEQYHPMTSKAKDYVMKPKNQ